MARKQLFYIRSQKHDQHYKHTEEALWWRANSQGYTHDIDQAGLYTEKQAKEICGEKNFTLTGHGKSEQRVPNNIAYPKDFVETMVRRTVNRFDLHQAFEAAEGQARIAKTDSEMAAKRA